MPKPGSCSWAIPLVLLLILSFKPAHAAQKATGSTLVLLKDSIKTVEDAPASGTMNPHKAWITRRTLGAGEKEPVIEFQVVLKMRNFPELSSRVATGELIGSREIAEKYEPQADDYQRVVDWLTAQGFTITLRDPLHISIYATGKVSLIEKVLQMKFAKVSIEGTEYTSGVSDPFVPQELKGALAGINGLQPHIRLHSHIILRPASLTDTSAPYTPAQILQAYGGNNLKISNTTLSGSGQTIAIVMDTAPLSSDLKSFWSTCGVSQTTSNFTKIDVAGTTRSKATLEASLDVEWSSSVAPGAKIRFYATTDLSSANLDKAYLQIYSDVINHPEYGLHQMSMSYGGGETYQTGVSISADHYYFTELAAAGVTIFASSGDGGSTPDSSGGLSGPLQVETPASDPNVTGVGGTSITLLGNGSVNTESAWSSSGGGTSIYFARPSWQTGTGVPSGNYRLVPDVAAPGDPSTGAIIFCGGVQSSVGGTSWSSPTWAGLCALINQARAISGYSPIGLLTPHLYPLLGTSNFRDIVAGSNNGGISSTGLYVAGTGYDEVTGIGTPQLGALVPALATSLQSNFSVAPPSLDIEPGQGVIFTATAGGSPLSYQWQRKPFGSSSWSNLTDGTVYRGSATSSLSISGATQAMSGDQFQCVATYSGGISVTSLAPGNLVVDYPLLVSTLAGSIGNPGLANGTGSSARFDYPSGMALDHSGNLYIADFANNNIRFVTPSGVVTTPYGSATGGSGSTNAAGNAASFNQPNAIVFDGSRYFYVADASNDQIRRIDSVTGLVTTVAGQVAVAGYVDGNGATTAEFNNPNGITLDSFGNLYVADSSNNVIRKIVLSTGTVSTLAGHPDPVNAGNAGDASYANGAGATAAYFSDPTGIATDGSGNVYVADLGNNVVRKITPAGVVSTYAGQAGITGAVDGPALQATFNAPNGLAIDASGNIYVADSNLGSGTGTYIGNNLLRKISSAGVVSTLAGQTGVSSGIDGIGSAATLNGLQAFAVGSPNILYIADAFNHAIRKGVILSLTGTATGTASWTSTMNATLYPAGAATNYFFEFGATTGYGFATYLQNAGSGTNAVPVFYKLTGLKPGTTYHYRVDAVTASGTVYGIDQTFTTAPFVDSDGDGMPDDYEIYYGLKPHDPSDANLDSDGDGFTNLQEYLAGTDPRNPQSRLGATVTLNGPDAIVNINTVAGKLYRIEYTTDLASGTWLVLADNVAGNGAVVQVSDSGALTGQRKFYRVKLLQ